MRLLFVFIALLPGLLPAGDGEKTLAALRGTRQYHETAISPDARSVAWTEVVRETGKGPSNNTEIYILDLQNTKAKPRRVTAGNGRETCRENGLAWSPDSVRLAFLSTCGDGKQAQLYLAPANGGAPRRLTSLTGFLANPRWSPDGSRLAVLFTENASKAAGAREPTAREVGVIAEKFDEQRITLIDLASGKPRLLSPADTYVYEYDWSPDGRRFAYTAAKGSGENNWWVAHLYTMDTGGTGVKDVLTPAKQIAVPRWSPDGNTIAFIAGIMSDQGSTGGDVFSVPASGGQPTNLTAGRKTSPAWLYWQSPEKLLITERLDGGSAITLLNPGKGTAETLWKGDEAIHAGGDDLSLSLAKDGRTSSVVRASWSRAPEVWTGAVGDWEQRTHANAQTRPLWGEAKKLHWTSDGAAVQGWLVYPQAFDPRKRYPMVVSVHGGPAAARTSTWPQAGADAVLLSNGYFLFYPNPRGSYGSGEKFTLGNVKDFGHGDLRDILSGVDEALRNAPIDEHRLGITGGSYGGYMTMWAVTQTNRFKAGVAVAGIANWLSYYGQNSIDEWMLPYFGASVYEDPAVYAKSSPITYIKNVKTPTLVVVGERDGECPPPQSYEFWHALKTLGVKTQLLVYPGEGHGIREPEHVSDLVDRTVKWFGENLR